MSGVQSYRELQIWQKSMDLCADCYKITSKLPADERFGLLSQMRRASVSVPSNIAEGFARETKGVFVNHLRIAQGSLKELETQLQICQRIGFLEQGDVESLLVQSDEVGRMIRSFIRSIPD
jgi:four helix bundle protein